MLPVFPFWRCCVKCSRGVCHIILSLILVSECSDDRLLNIVTVSFRWYSEDIFQYLNISTDSRNGLLFSNGCHPTSSPLNLILIGYHNELGCNVFSTSHSSLSIQMYSSNSNDDDDDYNCYLTVV